MTKDVSVNTLRLKYKGRFVEVRLSYRDSTLIDLAVVAPVSAAERASFDKMSKAISRLLYSGVSNKSSIVGTLEHEVGVDYDVFKFMLGVVKNKIGLK